MNTISLCRTVPELPETISRDLLIVQMLTLEQHLRTTNPIFEEDLYMALLGKLAGIYYEVNQFPIGWRLVVKSGILPVCKVPEKKYMNRIINRL